MLTTIKSAFAPIHPEGYRFIAIFAAITFAMFVFLPDFFGWVGVVLTAWCAYFFRDPIRVTPLGDDLVIAPADGRISLIETVTCPPELDLDGEQRVRVSIFMNVFDVHVNRAPVQGEITRLSYIAGKFVNAELDKASEDNERQALTVTMNDGVKIGFVQIAGLVARRIVKFVSQGDHLVAGQRFGLIRFGSRVDVYFPAGVEPLVCVGQRTIAGETVLAQLGSGLAQRTGRSA